MTDVFSSSNAYTTCYIQT